MMELLEDYIHEYKGFFAAKNGLCRIRIFANKEKTKIVGICTALPKNYTTSTTNKIEDIYQEVKTKFFEEKQKKPEIKSNELFDNLLKWSKIYESGKYLTLSIEILKTAWGYKSKYKKDYNLEDNNMIWVDHWPVEIGFRPWENEFAIVEFSNDLIPNWIHISEEQFVEFTGIDIRLINELELIEETEM